MTAEDSNDRKAMKTIVLIVPNSRWFDRRPWMSFPYSALILTALLKDKYNFSIVDANGDDLSGDQCFERVKAARPDAVLVTGGSFEYYKAAHLALAAGKRANPSAITILGGVYPTTLPEEAVKDPNLDWAFLNHAENRIVPFLELLFDGKIDEARRFSGIAYRGPNNVMIRNPTTSFIGDVKVMERPDYSLAEIGKYLKPATLDYQFNSDKATAYILTSYGCPYNCVFCASRTISGNRLVYRPVADVLDEIDFFVREHSIGNIIFIDEALLADRRRVNTILKSLIERGYNLSWKATSVSAWHLDDDLLDLMKTSGCTQLTISVESGCQRVLNEVIHKPLQLEIIPPLLKKCKELGIDLGANFVIGLPGETWEEIRETFRFAERCDFDVCHFHIATPAPATDLYRIAREKRLLPSDFSFTDSRFFGYCHGFITTDEFTPFELAVLRAFEWDRINFSTPEKIAKVARLYGTTLEKLGEHRVQTRRKLGEHF
ncbi:MAG TPA: radical SAM protein [Polyangia bacterium]|jgi:Fe-S oxidoreductase|nr:radical SAM protein [Polyangia bacterium]